MFLKLHSPQSRRRKFWSARGTYGGKRYELSTGAESKKDAQEIAARMEAAIIESSKGTNDMTFAAAAQSYIDYREPSERDCQFIDRICQYIGAKLIREISPHDVVSVANLVYGNGQAGSKNRAVMRPTAAVMHYAAKNNWCPWIRFGAFKEATTPTRYVADDVEQTLLKATKDEPCKYLLILWVFRQGDRIGDVLNTTYENCDLEKNIIQRHISKSNKHLMLPLDSEIAAILKGRGQQEGFIFPWRTRWGVNKWLRELTRSLGIKFTPHMARHTVGMRLSASGASLRVIMDKLGHADVKSSMRYQRTDIEAIRRASDIAKLGQNGGSDADK
jgi:integrase